ncbi:MAG: tRNA dihydrouridine synthase DusB [Burkholderiales bacterium]|jgi:tRNA-dihydrouridine synthase B|nr:tRNA dihydrouridine synthase DusB [Burkholderiales bacterium]
MYKIVLSPMAGITDAPFRHISRKYGADITISEMLTAQTNLWGSVKSQQRLHDLFTHDDKSKIIQIAGASPGVIVNAVMHCQAIGAGAIEINMGCPAKKVCNVLAGSALLKDEKLVTNILKAAVEASEIPVMLKTRLGWDDQQQNILTIARIAEDCGISSLAIHGRNRCDMYNGVARYELIATVKQQLEIPVYANGDLTTPEKVWQVLDYTAANGAYIGRAALGQPWIFRQIKEYLTSGSYTEISAHEKYATILEHIKLIYQHYGEIMGYRIARKHIKWYWQKLFANTVNEDLAKINQLESSTTQYQLVKSILEARLM